jgi:hypothetical protein
MAMFTTTHSKGIAMILKTTCTTLIISCAITAPAQSQEKFQEQLCEAAKTNRIVELVYDKDVSKGCIPRLLDVHQVAIGHNESLYVHGWQTRGCTKGRDFEAKRIFKFEKIKSVKIIDGEFSEKSRSIKSEGWDGCLGDNCFIDKNICE